MYGFSICMCIYFSENYWEHCSHVQVWTRSHTCWNMYRVVRCVCECVGGSGCCIGKGECVCLLGERLMEFLSVFGLFVIFHLTFAQGATVRFNVRPVCRVMNFVRQTFKVNFFQARCTKMNAWRWFFWIALWKQLFTSWHRISFVQSMLLALSVATCLFYSDMCWKHCTCITFQIAERVAIIFL